MAKGYWVVVYQVITSQDKVTEYAELAGPAIAKAGGRFVLRGGRQTVREVGKDLRTVVVEFNSYADAIAAYESADYQRAVAALTGGAERDVRIVEGV